MCNNLDILRRDHFHRYAVMPGGTDGGQLCFSQGAQPQWPRHWENREQHFSKRWRSGIHRLPTVQTRDHWVRGGSVDSTIFFSCPRFCTDLYADSLFEQLWQLSPSLQSITCMLSVPVSSSTSTRLRQISLRFSSLTSLQGNRREHRGAGSCSRRQQKTNDLPIRLSQTLRHSRGVDIHRRADVRMAKQFLLHLYVCAILIEQSRICMSKCVPAKPFDSGLFSRAHQPAPLRSPSVPRHSGTRAGEYPFTSLEGLRLTAAMFPQHFLKSEVHRYWSSRVLRLGFI